MIRLASGGALKIVMHGTGKQDMVQSLPKGLIVLTDFDQNTMANMTAALEYVCKRIPTEKDSHQFRKRIADAMIDCAKAGNRSYIDLQNTGMKVLDEFLRPPGFGQFWSKWLSSMPWRASR